MYRHVNVQVPTCFVCVRDLPFSSFQWDFPPAFDRLKSSINLVDPPSTRFALLQPSRDCAGPPSFCFPPLPSFSVLAVSAGLGPLLRSCSFIPLAHLKALRVRLPRAPFLLHPPFPHPVSSLFKALVALLEVPNFRLLNW